MSRFFTFSVILVGFSAVIVQLVALREFLSVFYGNELVLGVILGNWLLLIGTGAWLGRFSLRIKDKIGFFVGCQLMLAILLPATVFLIRITGTATTVPGEALSLVSIFIYSFLILLPFCLVSGFMVTLACGIFSELGKTPAGQVGRIYFFETLGSVCGGMLFSYVLIYLLESFQVIYTVVLLNLLLAFILSMKFNRKRLHELSIFFMLAFLIFLVNFDLQKTTNRLQYPGQEILFQKYSPYGNLVVTKLGSQVNFFENSVPLFTTEDAIANEEVVHYAMVQHENPKNVLLISGGVSGTLKEILKYNPERVDYVELDPLIIDAGKKFVSSSGINDGGVYVHNIDARLFVKNSNARYDVVIIDLPDPSSAQLNRFYTLEFFDEAKGVMNDGGVITLGLSSSENYMSPETKKLNSALYWTLKERFKNVMIIPGDRNFFVASDSELGYDIAERITERRIHTSYVNQYYLAGKLTPERIDYAIGSLKEKTELNQDFKPVSYYYHLMFWLKQFDVSLNAILAVIAVLFLVFLFKLKPIPFSVFAAGFAGMSLEVVVLLAFQVLYGYVYGMVGIIVAAFMAGAAVGAYWMNIKRGRMVAGDFARLVFAVSIYSLLLPFFIFGFSRFVGGFPVLTAVIGFLVGALFPLAGELHGKNSEITHTMGLLYGVDLLGACFGALLVSAILIPVVGIINVCLLTGMLNLVGFLRLKR